MMTNTRPISLVLLWLMLTGCDTRFKEDQTLKTSGDATFDGLLVRPDSTVILIQKPRKVVAMLDSQQMSWSVTLGEKIITSPVVANDSALYVLTSQKVYRLGNDGKIQFKKSVAMGGARGKESALFYLTAMSDSNVVVSNDWGKSIKIGVDGEQIWQFTLPEDARLVDPPISGPNGSLYLRTKRWLYSVSSHGRVRWRIQAGQGAFR